MNQISVDFITAAMVYLKVRAVRDIELLPVLENSLHLGVLRQGHVDVFDQSRSELLLGTVYFLFQKSLLGLLEVVVLNESLMAV